MSPVWDRAVKKLSATAVQPVSLTTEERERALEQAFLKRAMSAEKSVATDDRLYTMVTIRCYETACTPTVIDEFYINVWATPKQFEVLKEFFLEQLGHGDVEVIE